MTGTETAVRGLGSDGFAKEMDELERASLMGQALVIALKLEDENLKQAVLALPGFDINALGIDERTCFGMAVLCGEPVKVLQHSQTLGADVNLGFLPPLLECETNDTEEAFVWLLGLAACKAEEAHAKANLVAVAANACVQNSGWSVGKCQAALQKRGLLTEENLRAALEEALAMVQPQVMAVLENWGATCPVDVDGNGAVHVLGSGFKERPYNERNGNAMLAVKMLKDWGEDLNRPNARGQRPLDLPHLQDGELREELKRQGARRSE
ncbi:MAG: hypothetical protein GC129_02385 [Proteobacteria bacterium]|nr:hypothetical protein [Pseudomonadota bacterium]